MASLDDILTSVKNISTGLSNVAQTWRRGQGNLTSTPITGTTLVAAGAGRLVSISVVDDGSAEGSIYNSASIDGAATTNLIAKIPTGGGPEVLQLGIEFNAGIVVTPGTGQTLVATYYM